MTDLRDEVMRALQEHREGALICYDHPPTRDNWVWCCGCGAHGLRVSWREHMADALAPLLEEAR